MGGISEEDSSIYLNEINKLERKGAFALTFSYSRALQSSCIKIWGGKEDKYKAAGPAPRARAGHLGGLQGRVQGRLAAVHRGVALRQELRLLDARRCRGRTRCFWLEPMWNTE